MRIKSSRLKCKTPSLMSFTPPSPQEIPVSNTAQYGCHMLLFIIKVFMEMQAKVGRLVRMCKHANSTTQTVI